MWRSANEFEHILTKHTTTRVRKASDFVPKYNVFRAPGDKPCWAVITYPGGKTLELRPVESSLDATTYKGTLEKNVMKWSNGQVWYRDDGFDENEVNVVSAYSYCTSIHP